MPVPRKTTLATNMQELEARIATIDAEIHAAHRADEASQRLATIPGVGVLTASALVASIGDASQFKSARHLAAWLGLVPRQ
jgi:transposase